MSATQSKNTGEVISSRPSYEDLVNQVELLKVQLEKATKKIARKDRKIKKLTAKAKLVQTEGSDEDNLPSNSSASSAESSEDNSSDIKKYTNRKEGLEGPLKGDILTINCITKKHQHSWIFQKNGKTEN